MRPSETSFDHTPALEDLTVFVSLLECHASKLRKNRVFFLLLNSNMPTSSYVQKIARLQEQLARYQSHPEGTQDFTKDFIRSIMRLRPVMVESIEVSSETVQEYRSLSIFDNIDPTSLQASNVGPAREATHIGLIHRLIGINTFLTDMVDCLVDALVKASDDNEKVLNDLEDIYEEVAAEFASPRRDATNRTEGL